MKSLDLIFIILALLIFFSILPSVHAAQIHTFSINNEEKYFIYYWEGLNESKILGVRNRLITIMPIIEQWGGISFDKFKIVIVPDSFEDYQTIYKDAGILDRWEFTKEFYDSFRGAAHPLDKEFLIKESAYNSRAFDHELCHLTEYPFEFVNYFSEGEAGDCQVFLYRRLGEYFQDILDYDNKIYDSYAPEKRKLYTAAETDHELTYSVGAIFIEKLLDNAGVNNLSAVYVALRHDFSDLIDKYLGHGLHVPLQGLDGQEAVQCEFIKTYGYKVEPVFAEFGFPDQFDCDAKIKEFKDTWLRVFDNYNLAQKKKNSEYIAATTETDKWIGSESVDADKKIIDNEESNLAENDESMVLTKEPETKKSGAFSFALILIVLVAAGAYYLFKIRKTRR